MNVAKLTVNGLLGILLASSVQVSGEDDLNSEIKRGELVYSQCQGCHSLDWDRSGPRHCYLFGRRIGSISGFPYSKAMLESDIVWDEFTLDAFLKNPAALVPENNMPYSGLSSEQERTDLIAYLVYAAGNRALCSPIER